MLQILMLQYNPNNGENDAKPWKGKQVFMVMMHLSIGITNMLKYQYILTNALTYIGIFPVYLRMAMIFPDFPTGSGLNNLHFWKSGNIKAILTEKNSSICRIPPV